jgi:glycosyltransferase involved in cell wall biosynthesis
MDTRAASIGDERADARATAHGIDGPVLDLVVPVHNEAHVLERQIHRLREELTDFPFSARVTIAENGSTDATPVIARRLAAELSATRALCLREPGRGRALRTAWRASDALVCAYTDVDLSTSLTALVPLVVPLLTGRSDITVGSRLVGGSHVSRSVKREVISRSYNLIVRSVLGTHVRDAQCGFKAIRTDVAHALLPEVEDDGWFFDTELLVRAERHGYRVFEVPVDWVEDRDSRVRIARTAWDDLRGVGRLARELGVRRMAPDAAGRGATAPAYDELAA